jgi:uncharacterized membrane protein YfcA
VSATFALVDPVVLILVALGGFLGGMATGAAGFAYGVVASAIWLQVISPVHAAFLVVSAGLINQAALNWPLRRSIDTGRLMPFLIGGLIGVPIGVLLVVEAAPSRIRTTLAAFMLAYGVYTFVAPRIPVITGGGRTADGAVGFLGGVLGGLAGLSGVLPAIWTQLRGWPKDTARAVYQPFILAAHLLTLVLIGTMAVDKEAIVLFIVALPAVLLGSWFGWSIYDKLDERRFRQLFAGLLVISALVMILFM